MCSVKDVKTLMDNDLHMYKHIHTEDTHVQKYIHTHKHNGFKYEQTHKAYVNIGALY